MSLEQIYDLEPDDSELLYSSPDTGEILEVRQWQQYRWLHLGDKSVQALMMTNAVEQIALPNIQALLATLLFNPEPKRLLNLGLGGASLERFLNLNFPELELKSVESNKKIIELAKEYFYLPEKIDVIHSAADEFVQEHKQRYDIILSDIFVADSQANCLYDESFYKNISDCIEETGILAINILPQSEEDVVNVLLPMKNYFGYLYLLEFPDFSNAIIFASRQKIPDSDELLKRAERLLDKTKLDLIDIPERLNVLLETV